MSNPAQSATAVAEQFIIEFNGQNHEGLAATLNFPHVRLANGRFATVNTADEFVQASRRGATRLADEGWHHTELSALDAVQVSADKVHLVLAVHRCREDGEVYNTFDTLWIATLVDGHWGIQFRSSYLR